MLTRGGTRRWYRGQMRYTLYTVSLSKSVNQNHVLWNDIKKAVLCQWQDLFFFLKLFMFTCTYQFLSHELPRTVQKILLKGKL